MQNKQLIFFNEFSILKLINIFILILTLILTITLLISNPNACFGLKNPFISPFKAKTYKNIEENPLNGLELQAIISMSNQNKNIAIINNKPYYKDSKIMGKTIVQITRKAVIIKLKDGKIVKLVLSKFEGFKK